MNIHKPFVYLCGPITGQTLSDAKSWRESVIEKVKNFAECIDPTRDSPDTVRRSSAGESEVSRNSRLVHGQATVTRDRFDVQRCDAVFAYFLGADSVSLGSVGEIFWADSYRKPVIIVREHDNPHNHDMLNAIAGWICPDLDSAIQQLRRLLRPNTLGEEEETQP